MHSFVQKHVYWVSTVCQVQWYDSDQGPWMVYPSRTVTVVLCKNNKMTLMSGRLNCYEVKYTTWEIHYESGRVVKEGL